MHPEGLLVATLENIRLTFAGIEGYHKLEVQEVHGDSSDGYGQTVSDLEMPNIE